MWANKNDKIVCHIWSQKFWLLISMQIIFVIFFISVSEIACDKTILKCNSGW